MLRPAAPDLTCNGSRLWQLSEGGYAVESLTASGFSLAELKDVGTSLAAMKESGASVQVPNRRSNAAPRQCRRCCC